MDRAAVCRRWFERKYLCSGRLNFDLVGVVGRGLLVMTGTGNGSPNLRFFPSRCFYAVLSLCNSDKPNLFVRFTVYSTTSRRSCSGSRFSG